MAEIIKINTNRLGADADRIHSYIENIIKEISNMRQSVTVLEKMWEGSAKSAFYKAFWNDIKVIETVVNELKAIYEYDINAKKKYEQCDKQISFLIAEIPV